MEMMMLGAMWMMAAAMVGFMLGRMSMYGQMEALELAGTGESGRVCAGGATYADENVYADRSGHTGGRAYTDRGAHASGRAHADGRACADGDTHTGETTCAYGSAEAGEGRRGLMRRGKAHRVMERVAWSVGSPVSGVVTARREGERAVALIYPEGDFLYAPVAGKVTKLFPMGNAFRLATESGEELHLRVGEVGDDLMGRYYRPRVVQNEFVAKGKVLLEFDRAGLEAEGIPAEVAVWIESCGHGGIRVVADGERARIGEEILQVVE